MSVWHDSMNIPDFLYLWVITYSNWLLNIYVVWFYLRISNIVCFCFFLVWTTVSICAMETFCPPDYRLSRMQWTLFVTPKHVATLKTMWASSPWPSKGPVFECMYFHEKICYYINTVFTLPVQQLWGVDHTNSRHSQDTVQAPCCAASGKH